MHATLSFPPSNPVKPLFKVTRVPSPIPTRQTLAEKLVEPRRATAYRPQRKSAAKAAPQPRLPSVITMASPKSKSNPRSSRTSPQTPTSRIPLLRRSSLNASNISFQHNGPSPRRYITSKASPDNSLPRPPCFTRIPTPTATKRSKRRVSAVTAKVETKKEAASPHSMPPALVEIKSELEATSEFAVEQHIIQVAEDIFNPVAHSTMTTTPEASIAEPAESTITFDTNETTTSVDLVIGIKDPVDDIPQQMEQATEIIQDEDEVKLDPSWSTMLEMIKYLQEQNELASEPVHLRSNDGRDGVVCDNPESNDSARSSTSTSDMSPIVDDSDSLALSTPPTSPASTVAIFEDATSEKIESSTSFQASELEAIRSNTSLPPSSPPALPESSAEVSPIPPTSPELVAAVFEDVSPTSGKIGSPTSPQVPELKTTLPNTPSLPSSSPSLPKFSDAITSTEKNLVTTVPLQPSRIANASNATPPVEAASASRRLPAGAVATELVITPFGPRRVRKHIPHWDENVAPSPDARIRAEIAALRSERKVGGSDMVPRVEEGKHLGLYEKNILQRAKERLALQ